MANVAAVSFFALVVTAGVGAWQTRPVWTGIQIGLWTALLVGLLTFWTLLLLLYFDRGFLVTQMNAGEQQAFAASGWQNRAT